MTRRRKYLLPLFALAVVGVACWGAALLLKEPTGAPSVTVMLQNSTANALYVRILFLNPDLEAGAFPRDMPVDQRLGRDIPTDQSTAGMLAPYETGTFKISPKRSSSTALLAAYAQTVPVAGNEAKYSMQFFTSPLDPDRHVELGQLQIDDRIAIEFRRDQLKTLTEIVSSGIEPDLR